MLVSKANHLLYQIKDELAMIPWTPPDTIEPGQSIRFEGPFTEKGMRISGQSQWPVEERWNAQASFEFGYSTYYGQEGTAYDLSIMEGSDMEIGLSVHPSNTNCQSKTCKPSDCLPDQGWTSSDQIEDGGPAGTVCYAGRADFDVVFCP